MEGGRGREEAEEEGSQNGYSDETQAQLEQLGNTLTNNAYQATMLRNHDNRRMARIKSACGTQALPYPSKHLASFRSSPASRRRLRYAATQRCSEESNSGRARAPLAVVARLRAWQSVWPALGPAACPHITARISTTRRTHHGPKPISAAAHITARSRSALPAAAHTHHGPRRGHQRRMKRPLRHQAKKSLLVPEGASEGSALLNLVR